MSTGMRKWMEKDCPYIPFLPAEVCIDREELRQLRDELTQYKNERDALRAKIEQMEQQKPIAWGAFYFGGKLNGKLYSQCDTEAQIDMYIADRHQSDDSNTFRKAPLYATPGAQPAPSVPDGWLRAIDEALLTAHISVANAHDTYEQAKAKLDSLIGLHVDIATDPAVNGGWKLVPIEPTTEMIQKACSDHGYPCGDRSVYARGYRTMLAAAPEAKP